MTLTRRALLTLPALAWVTRRRRRMAMYPDQTGIIFAAVIGASGEILVYDGTPANGNLIASISGAAGTDNYQNPFLKGIVDYINTGKLAGLTVQLNSGIITFLDQLSPDTVTHNAAAGIIHQSIAGQSPVLFVDSPSTGAAPGEHAAIWMVGANTGAGLPRIYLFNGVDTTLDVLLAGSLRLSTLVNSLPVAQNRLNLGAGNEFQFDSDLLVGTGGSSASLIRVSQDASGYPKLTDQAGYAQNVSGCGLATSNVNTVTQTAFNNLSVFGITASDAEAGAVYEIEISGYGTQATGAAVALTLQPRFGASPGAATDVVGTPITVTFPSAAGDHFLWSARLRAQCVTSGVAATWRLTLTGTITDTVANTSSSFAVGTGEVANDVTRDSTAAISFGLSAKWASTTGAPTITKSAAQFGRRA